MIAGLLHPVGASAPYWVGVGVLAVGVIVFLLTAHTMAGRLGEKVLWARWNKAARAVEGTPEEAMSEL